MIANHAAANAATTANARHANAHAIAALRQNAATIANAQSEPGFDSFYKKQFLLTFCNNNKHIIGK